FFFQEEDGIRDATVTGVQTCALPIYDLAIVGGGSAGYAAARTAAREGLKTVVIEGGEEVGGLCILRGCMPTKALLYAAEVMHLEIGRASCREGDEEYRME